MNRVPTRFARTLIPAAAALALLRLPVALGQDSVQTQLAAEQSHYSQLTQQLMDLQNQYNAVKQQHDTLQQQYARDASTYNSTCAGRPVNFDNCGQWQANMLNEQRTLTPQVLQLEAEARGMQTQAQQLVAELADSRNRISQLQAQTAALRQARDVAASSHLAVKILQQKPTAIEAAKEQSNCGFDTTGPECARNAPMPRVEAPPASEVVSPEVARDPEYQRYAAERNKAAAAADAARKQLERVTALQKSETDPQKRAQDQIEIYRFNNELETANSAVRVADIGIAKVKKRIEGAPIYLPGAGAGKGRGGTR